MHTNGQQFFGTQLHGRNGDKIISSIMYNVPNFSSSWILFMPRLYSTLRLLQSCFFVKKKLTFPPLPYPSFIWNTFSVDFQKIEKHFFVNLQKKIVLLLIFFFMKNCWHQMIERFFFSLKKKRREVKATNFLECGKEPAFFFFSQNYFFSGGKTKIYTNIPKNIWFANHRNSLARILRSEKNLYLTC